MMTVNQINELVNLSSTDGHFSRNMFKDYGFSDLADLIQLDENAISFDQICRLVLGGTEEVEQVDFLPKHRLYGTEEIVGALDAIKEVIACGEFTSGSKSEEFESVLSAYMGNSEVALCNSGTSALTISLLALGVGVGDEVIVQANSFAATENSIYATGAKPVFVDVDKFYGISIESVRDAISSKTKVIMPVHLYGRLSNMPKIKDLADAYGLYVVEDACQAFGLSEVGRYSDLAAISFNPYKNFGVFGKAGAICTYSKELIKTAKKISYHGFEVGIKNKKGLHWGFNAQIDNLQAAIALKKLKFFEVNSFKRALLAKRYIEELGTIKNLDYIPNFQSSHTWHHFPIRLKNKDDVKPVRKMMKERFGVSTDHYYPILAPDNIADKLSYRSMGLDVTRSLHDRTFNLPIYQNLTYGEQTRVINSIKYILKEINNA